VVWRSADRTPLVEALLAALDQAGPFTYTPHRLPGARQQR
jgi:hypothetical protein